MALWTKILKFAHDTSIEAQTNLVEEFKVAWVGIFGIDSGGGGYAVVALPPHDCMFPGGRFRRG